MRSLIDTMHGVDAAHLLHGRQISVDRVSMRYATGTTALEDVSLSVGRGEFVAIVGPSGCGKSTLLRLAAGLEQPTEGSVALATESVAFIFQDPTLLPWRSVRKNVELLTQLAKMPKDERARRVDAAVDAVGLTGFAKQLPKALSGGMRMRVSLARALALEPEVMLLDEPFGALDEMTRDEMQNQLLDLHRREEFTAMLVTHSVSEAVYLADRVVVMSARPGRISGVVEVGLPRDRDGAIRFDQRFTDRVAEVSALLHGKG
ncbi:ABC transporter ATP-binding protein [Actinocorallia aurea]